MWGQIYAFFFCCALLSLFCSKKCGFHEALPKTLVQTLQHLSRITATTKHFALLGPYLFIFTALGGPCFKKINMRCFFLRGKWMRDIFLIFWVEAPAQENLLCFIYKSTIVLFKRETCWKYDFILNQPSTRTIFGSGNLFSLDPTENFQYEGGQNSLEFL